MAEFAPWATAARGTILYDKKKQGTQTKKRRRRSQTLDESDEDPDDPDDENFSF